MRGWFREAFALLAGVGIFIAYVAHFLVSVFDR
jgi:hypothetical protein